MLNKAKKDGRKQIFRPKPGSYQLSYGWRWLEDLSTIVEDEGEQGVIARAKALAASGLSLGGIRAAFKSGGVMNRAGNSTWSIERIRYCVRYSGLGPYWLKRKAALDAAAMARERAAEEARRPVRVPFDEADPVKWGEAFLVNRDGEARRYWEHQVEDLRAEEGNIIHLDGRDVGKTADLSTLALHYAMTTAKGSGLIAAALGGQLLSILEEIEFQFEQNARLDECVAVGKNGHRKFQRTPYPRIEFKNGSVLYFRPAGPYGDAFRSLHVDRIWVDEGAWLSEEAWRALRQCLKSGGKIRVYSTPNGVRNATYYRLTESARWRVFRWPSWINPTWTKERETDLLEFYGGRSSAGWQHEVAGEHGAASYGVFAPECFARCVGDVLEYRKVAVTHAELDIGGAECLTEAETELRLQMLLGVVPGPGVYWIGGDLGYTRDPTEIVVFREEEEAEDCRLKTEGDDGRTQGGRLQMVLRVHMESVGYPQIAQCLAVLDAAYSPAGIGIDNGGNGLAVVQELMSLDKYRERGFAGRLMGFDFGGVTAFSLADGTEARNRTKELMTSLINGALQRRRILFPSSDREIEDQFLTQTYSLANGRVVYSKGNDHVIDAVRCMMLVREKAREDGTFGDGKPMRSALPPVVMTFGGSGWL